MRVFVFKFILVFCLIGFSTACNKDCDEVNSPECKIVPPIDEDCQAYFLNWFYNAESKSCEQIGYSGCSDVGFETREECEICLCK